MTLCNHWWAITLKPPAYSDIAWLFSWALILWCMGFGAFARVSGQMAHGRTVWSSPMHCMFWLLSINVSMHFLGVCATETFSSIKPIWETSDNYLFCRTCHVWFEVNWLVLISNQTIRLMSFGWHGRDPPLPHADSLLVSPKAEYSVLLCCPSVSGLRMAFRTIVSHCFNQITSMCLCTAFSEWTVSVETIMIRF